jgi:DNA-directed RNA polymerase specialized sigma24 family protein
MKSRVKGDFHARFRENVGVRFPCVTRLNDADKAVISLYLEELSYKEISDITGLSENHVAVKIKRIKMKLLTCIKEKI